MFRFFIVVISFVALPAQAEIYLTQSQALEVVFGEECMQSYEPKIITPDIRSALKKEGLLGEPEAKNAHFFVCKDRNAKITGYALIDEEVGKHLPITYIVGISPAGRATRVEMMVFREIRGWEVRERKFMAQFEGKNGKDDLSIGHGISNITGATLSSRAIAKGVARALFLWARFYGTT